MGRQRSAGLSFWLSFAGGRWQRSLTERDFNHSPGALAGLGALLRPPPHPAHPLGHLGGVAAGVVVVDHQLEAGQVGQAGEVADGIAVHVDHLQRRHVQEHGGELGQQVAREPDGAQLAQAPQAGGQRAQRVGAGVQRLEQAELTHHLGQLLQAVGFDPEGPEVLQEPQLERQAAELVVAQVEDAELLQRAHGQRQRSEVVEVQCQNLQVLQLLKLRRELCQVVVAQVQLDQFPEGADVQGQPPQLPAAQVHHFVHGHLLQVLQEVLLALIGGHKSHNGFQAVAHLGSFFVRRPRAGAGLGFLPLRAGLVVTPSAQYKALFTWHQPLISRALKCS